MSQNYHVYILANKNNGVLYIGVTNDIRRRISEHKSGEIPGFTKRYNVNKLVYAELYTDIEQAIAREKQLKHWSRQKKLELVSSFNPEWNDLEP